MADPRVGEMILYDYIRPALLAGEYRLRVGTEVDIDGTGQPLPGQDFYFDVEGPRFSLAPNEVAGVFPPRNGHGPFDSALPHIALGRRTLPWERALGDAYTAEAGDTPYPFLALVLFEQSECTILHNQALTDVVPKDVYDRLGRPAGIQCDAVEADQQLLKDILPMPAELQLLTHVRQVNIDDRELAAGDSDGYFAVVMSNRIPRSGASYVCCLVSVEERTDLLPTTDTVGFGGYLDPSVAEITELTAMNPSSLGQTVAPSEADKFVRTTQAGVSGALIKQTANTTTTFSAAATKSFTVGLSQDQLAADTTRQRLSAEAKVAISAGFLQLKARLVLLHSWTFTCEGDGTFRQLMQGLDVGMIGDVDPADKLAVTDTGHISIDVIDRLGAPEQSWYRGPFVTQPVTRDPLGPYHSADQARRVVAETGAENISYAAAFEVGRLLAAADARLAQELMRWRRGSFRAGARQSSINLLQAVMRLNLIEDPLDPVALSYSVDVLAKMALGIAPPIDRYGIEVALASPLLQPEAVAKAFRLDSVDAARALLGGDIGLAQAITVPTVGRAVPTTNLDQVLADQTGLAALVDLRTRAIGNLGTPVDRAAPTTGPATHDVNPPERGPR